MMLSTAGLIITLAVGILSAPVTADAQKPGRPYRIGALHPAYFANHPAVEGLKAALKATGLGAT